jgi:hypothetical protein
MTTRRPEKYRHYFTLMYSLESNALDGDDIPAEAHVARIAASVAALAANDELIEHVGMPETEEIASVTATNSQSPCLGERVYWNDPDAGACSGYGRFIRCIGPESGLIEKNGFPVEVFLHELTLTSRANPMNQSMRGHAREADGHTYAMDHPECGQIEGRWVGFPTNADGTCDFDPDTGTLVADMEFDVGDLHYLGRLRRSELLAWLAKAERRVEAVS